MKIGSISRILKDDLAKGGAVPAWVEYLISPLNEFISVATQALRGNLTFQDNFLCKQTTLELTHGVEVEVNPQSSLKVIGMIPLNALKESVDASGFRLKSSGLVGVTFYFRGGVAATKDTVTFLLLFG